MTLLFTRRHDPRNDYSRLRAYEADQARRLAEKHDARSRRVGAQAQARAPESRLERRP